MTKSEKKRLLVTTESSPHKIATTIKLGVSQRNGSLVGFGLVRDDHRLDSGLALLTPRNFIFVGIFSLFWFSLQDFRLCAQ